MLNKWLVWIVVTGMGINLAFARTDPSLMVSDIIISGNTHTEEDVLLREMLLKPGDVYSDSLRRVSEDRLYNLQLFNSVEIVPIPDHNRVTLWVNVTERLFFYPVPVLRLEDRDWAKISYGLGVVHTNFRGRNEYLFAELVFGNRPGYSFKYYNPWIGQDERYTLGFTLLKYSLLSKYTVLNDIPAFNEQHIFGVLNSGRYWGRYFSAAISLMYENIQADPAGRAFLDHSGGDDVLGVGLTLQYDSRDLKQYPSYGRYVNLTAVQSGIAGVGRAVTNLSGDMRYYKPLGPFTVAGRLFHSRSYGRVPFYQLSYFGFLERIRGHFSQVSAGTRRFLAAFEMRYPLVPLFHISLPSDNLPNGATQNLRFGLNLALFVDSGQAWTDAFNLKGMQTGFGMGVHIRVPYAEVVRLEWAFDEQLRSEFIIEAKTAF
ncbi:MAG: hypothetical protein D6677_12025 [Calditrichaeota bacterium]|nr:MAG: hypothetical protein D6677_12025 [Calditrichota bacterium]